MRAVVAASPRSQTRERRPRAPNDRSSRRSVEVRDRLVKGCLFNLNRAEVFVAGHPDQQCTAHDAHA